MSILYKTELHVHTRFSKDSILSYVFLLIMLKIKKINTIAITDHNEIRGAVKYKNRLEKMEGKTRVMLISTSVGVMILLVISIMMIFTSA